MAYGYLYISIERHKQYSFYPLYRESELHFMYPIERYGDNKQVDKQKSSKKQGTILPDLM